MDTWRNRNTTIDQYNDSLRQSNPGTPAELFRNELRFTVIILASALNLAYRTVNATLRPRI